MELSEKEFNGILLLTIDKIKKALCITPDNKELQELLSIFQLMLEDE